MSDQRELRILVVDDDPLVRDAVVRIVSELRAVVAQAADTSEAIAHLGRAKFDVVISDWQMPGGGGERLVESLIGTPTPLPAVIIVTGSAADMNTMAWPGWRLIHKVLEKPLTPDELLDAVRAASDDLRA